MFQQMDDAFEAMMNMKMQGPLMPEPTFFDMTNE